MRKARLLLVDDQVLFVESLKTVLETRAEDFKVIGIAHDGLEAIQLAEKNRPDIILMDVRMPKMDGVEATRQIKKRFPEIPIIMLTTFDDDAYVQDALAYGAVGYLLKEILPEELISSVRAAIDGAVLISPSVAAKLVQSHAQSKEQGRTPEEEPASTPPWKKELSKREIQVLRLLSEGFSNKDIAEKLYIAEQTVKNHVSVIYSKLGVHDRLEAIKKTANLKSKL